MDARAKDVRPRAARDGCAPEDGLYRELEYLRDDSDRRVACIAAGCDLGWRSPRWVPRLPATWAPFSVLAFEADEDRARALWRRHLELDGIAAHPLRVDAATTMTTMTITVMATTVMATTVMATMVMATTAMATTATTTDGDPDLAPLLQCRTGRTTCPPGHLTARTAYSPGVFSWYMCT